MQQKEHLVFNALSFVLRTGRSRKLPVKIDESEMSDCPFPRSEKALEALARLRGSKAEYDAEEALMLLRDKF